MKNILIENAVPKTRKYHRLNGVTPTNSQGVYNAEINMEARTIRIFGTMTNHCKGPQAFDKTFAVGDQAEYDSFNLRYVGTIVRIAAKTITVKHYANSSTVTQLDVYTFIDRNWDFDAAKIEAENAEESRYL
jgi:hypothetical protein